MTSKYIYFISKSSTVIYKLCIGKGTAKERLRECEVEIMLHTPVPERLLPLKEKLENNLFHSGFRNSSEIGMSLLAKSLYGKKTQLLQNSLKTFMIYMNRLNHILSIPNNSL